jgi:hypothetical protein
MPVTANIKTKMTAALAAIEADAPNLHARLTLRLALLNAARTGAGSPKLTMTDLVLNHLVDSALADDWLRLRKDIEALKTQEAETQLEVEIQALRDAL